MLNYSQNQSLLKANHHGFQMGRNQLAFSHVIPELWWQYDTRRIFIHILTLTYQHFANSVKWIFWQIRIFFNRSEVTSMFYVFFVLSFQQLYNISNTYLCLHLIVDSGQIYYHIFQYMLVLWIQRRYCHAVHLWICKGLCSLSLESQSLVQSTDPGKHMTTCKWRKNWIALWLAHNPILYHIGKSKRTCLVILLWSGWISFMNFLSIHNILTSSRGPPCL